MAEDTQVALRDERGRMLAPLPGGAAPITTATARSMAAKRWENYRRAAVKRIVGEASSIDPTVSTAADAFGLVAAKQYTTLMDSDKPRIGDLEKLGQIMTGVVSGEQSRREDAAPGTVSASPEALLQLVQLIEAERSAAVDRARAIDTTIRNDIQDDTG